jgi:hypothetical protein
MVAQKEFFEDNWGLVLRKHLERQLNYMYTYAVVDPTVRHDYQWSTSYVLHCVNSSIAGKPPKNPLTTPSPGGAMHIPVRPTQMK